jgi:alkanesulfonate monooxygenase SsuD/methylene tetrahydromethanopterin reductase-like flavin-dependent oxidoreductase (luciferase family)
VFVIDRNRELAQTSYREFKHEVARLGRDPDLVKILPAVYCVAAETRSMAADKAAYIEGLAEPMDALVLLSEVLNYDFAQRSMDEPFSDEDLASISGLQAIRDGVIRDSGRANPTTRDFIKYSGRGTLAEHPRFIGTPKDVADELEEWFATEACDGFVLAATHMPGAYEDFVRLVVPELQRRGLHQREYAGATLRENLGLQRAQRGDWMTG